MINKVEPMQIYNAIELIRYTVKKGDIKSYNEAVDALEKITDIIEQKFTMIDKSEKRFDQYAYLYELSLYKTFNLILSFANSRKDYEKIKYICDKIINNPNVIDGKHFFYSEAHVGLAVVEKHTGNIDEAAKKLRKTLDMSNSPDACLELAYLELERDNLEIAKRLFLSLKSKDEFLSIYQKQVHISLAKIYKANKDLENAIRELDELADKQEKFLPHVLLEKGKIYYTLNDDFSNARKCFEELLNVAKSDFDKIAAYTELAIIEKLNHNYPKAIKYCKLCKEIDPDNQFANIILGEVLELTEERDKSLGMYYEVFISGNNEDKSEAARKLIGPAYEADDQEKLAKFIDFLINSKKLKDRNLGYYYRFLIDNRNNADNEVLLDSCKRIVGDISSFMKAYDFLAYCYAKEGRVGKIDKLINEAIRNNDREEFILYFKILKKFTLNDFENIYEDIDKLIEYDGPFIAAELYRLGRFVQKTNYKLTNYLFDKARSYDTNYHHISSVFYALTFNAVSQKDIDYHIKLINELMSDKECDPLNVVRLKACLSKTLILGGYYDEAKIICHELMNSDDPFYSKLATIRLGSILRIEGDYEKADSLLKLYIDDPSISELAFLQYIKNVERTDIEKAFLLTKERLAKTDNFYLRYEYARILITKKDYETAKNILLELVNVKNDFRSFVGLCYKSLAFIELADENMEAYNKYSDLVLEYYPLIADNNRDIVNDYDFLLTLK